jgi:hypothetical protein
MGVVTTDEENHNRYCRNAKSNGFFGLLLRCCSKEKCFAFFQKKLTVGNLKLMPKLTVNLPQPTRIGDSRAERVQ